MKYLKFETVYRNSREYVLYREAGSNIASQQKYQTKNNPMFDRRVYISFKQDVLAMFGFEPDTNAWVLDQNELKTKYTGKETLKALCKTFYLNSEADYLAKGI